ncbi:helical backbone metal receptor [Flavobacterium agricola]|uniref:Helical backbone metal receptor n=1 Tax=Flavobacterium agricola TaxID=2870839 RepID=A0ABY6M1Y1_9FLAO|nr:helical backbone metal receptor [Flavobacterium agricola]UYW02568.1 helical backbone metal receptor [Flavobacterium agricola]
MKQVTDQLGNNFTFAETPKRIISLVPSLTELLYEMGLENEIIGVTKFCVHPFHFKTTKISVGGTKQVNYDKIEALQPDIIICNKEENTQEMIEALRKICPNVFVTDIITIQDCLDAIETLGVIFNKRTNAKKIIDKIIFAHDDFQEFMKNREPQKVAYFIWATPYMAVGRDNFINSLLKLNKFQNIYESRDERYPEVIIQKLRIQGDPDIVFLPSEPFPFKDEHAFELGRHTHHAQAIFVDGEMFSWYGSRLIKAFDYFKRLHLRMDLE